MFTSYVGVPKGNSYFHDDLGVPFGIIGDPPYLGGSFSGKSRQKIDDLEVPPFFRNFVCYN